MATTSFEAEPPSASTCGQANVASGNADIAVVVFCMREAVAIIRRGLKLEETSRFG